MKALYKDIIASGLIIAVGIIGIYTQINGIDYTQGQLLLHYWKAYTVAFCFGGIALWLMIK